MHLKPVYQNFNFTQFTAVAFTSLLLQMLLMMICSSIFSISPKPGFPNHMIAWGIFYLMLITFWFPSILFALLFYYAHVDPSGVVMGILLVAGFILNSLFQYALLRLIRYRRHPYSL